MQTEVTACPKATAAEIHAQHVAAQPQPHSDRVTRIGQPSDAELESLPLIDRVRLIESLLFSGKTGDGAYHEAKAILRRHAKDQAESKPAT